MPADALRRLPQVAVLGSLALYWGLGMVVPLTVPLAVLFTLTDLSAVA